MFNEQCSLLSDKTFLELIDMPIESCTMNFDRAFCGGLLAALLCMLSKLLTSDSKTICLDVLHFI